MRLLVSVQSVRNGPRPGAKSGYRRWARMWGTAGVGGKGVGATCEEILGI